MISRCSCSVALDKLQVQAGSSPSAWRQSELLCPCLSTGGLCCFVLLQAPSLNRPHASSVCQVLLCSETFSVNCLYFFISHFISPNTTHFLCIFFISVFLSVSVFSSSLCSSSSSSLPHLCQLPSLGLCCAVATHRSDQDRWCQMISGLYSFLQETAWYCCWRDALTGCLQVHQPPKSNP